MESAFRYEKFVQNSEQQYNKRNEKSASFAENLVKLFLEKRRSGVFDTPSLASSVLPINVQYSTYIHQGTNIRDIRSRVITMVIDVESLKLSGSALEKFIRLAGKRYDQATKKLTIITDRCHTRKQNLDYAHYLLTVLFHEANKVEQWDGLQERADNLKVEFEGSTTKTKLVDMIEKAKGAGLKADEKAIDEFGEMWKTYGEDETKALMEKFTNQTCRRHDGLQLFTIRTHFSSYTVSLHSKNVSLIPGQFIVQSIRAKPAHPLNISRSHHRYLTKAQIDLKSTPAFQNARRRPRFDRNNGNVADWIRADQNADNANFNLPILDDGVGNYFGNNQNFADDRIQDILEDLEAEFIPAPAGFPAIVREIPVACPVVGCGRIFNSIRTLQAHLGDHPIPLL